MNADGRRLHFVFPPRSLRRVPYDGAFAMMTLSPNLFLLSTIGVYLRLSAADMICFRAFSYLFSIFGGNRSSAAYVCSA